MAFELPYLPPGYSPAQVQRAAYEYAASHGYRGPHMVMQEGHIEVRDGVPGFMVKYVDANGLSTTEWTPLPASAPPPAAPAAPAAAAPQTAVEALANPQHVPDAQNPKAVDYALMRLQQLRALGLNPTTSDDPTADWRNASVGLVDLAHSRGYDNPRDMLAGRPRNHPVDTGLGPRSGGAPQHPVGSGPSVGPPQHPVGPRPSVGPPQHPVGPGPRIPQKQGVFKPNMPAHQLPGRPGRHVNPSAVRKALANPKNRTPFRSGPRR